MTQTIRILAILLLALPAAAGDLLSAELDVLGERASSLWKAQEIGGRGDVGGTREVKLSGPNNTADKLKAAGLSLLLPGAGQFYNGDKDKALIFLGAEAAVWTGYLVFNEQAQGLEEDYQEYAGIFAGTSGEHNEKYWRAVGRNMDSDEYNTDLLRVARSEGTEPTGLIGAEDAWFWSSEQHRENYKSLRADATRAYDRRDFTILFAIVNRAVSVYDAVRGAGSDDHLMEVAGLGFDIESRRVIGRKGTACVFSTSF